MPKFISKDGIWKQVSTETASSQPPAELVEEPKPESKPAPKPVKKKTTKKKSTN